MTEFIQKTQLPKSTPVLILGILSIVTCFCYGVIGLILGIIALVLAKGDLALYHENPDAYTGYENLRAGRICAIIGVSLSALYLIFIILAMVFAGSADIMEMLEQME